MTAAYLDPEKVERWLHACLEQLEEEPSTFTLWERSFLEDLEDYLDGNVITEAQAGKLYQIYEERV